MENVETSRLTSIGGSFCLIDHDGHNVSDETYRGQYVLIFFGFTNCRVVCPRALTKLSAVLDSLGPLADRIRPIYVTVDPERDTPDAMRSFLQSYPRFTGLTGSLEQIDRMKKAYRVFAQRVDDLAGKGEYAGAHRDNLRRGSPRQICVSLCRRAFCGRNSNPFEAVAEIR
jgi:protein SCO1/2